MGDLARARGLRRTDPATRADPCARAGSDARAESLGGQRHERSTERWRWRELRDAWRGGGPGGSVLQLRGRRGLRRDRQAGPLHGEAAALPSPGQAGVRLRRHDLSQRLRSVARGHRPEVDRLLPELSQRRRRRVRPAATSAKPNSAVAPPPPSKPNTTTNKNAVKPNSNAPRSTPAPTT